MTPHEKARTSIVQGIPAHKKAREDSRDGTEKREDWPGPPSFQEPTSDHRAGDLRVVYEAAAERTGNMIMLRNMSNIKRLCDLSPLINMATIQLDDNGGVGVKLHAICLKRHTHICGCMGAGAGGTLSRKGLLPPPSSSRPLGALLSIITTTTGHAARASLSPRPNWPSLPLLSFPPPKSNNFYQSRE